MDNLPVEIWSDIFSRLPADFLLECQRVCKTWRDILLSSCFSAIQLLRHNHDLRGIGTSKVSLTLGFIFLVKSETPKSTCHPLYYGDFDENNTTDHNEMQNVLRPINHTLFPTGQKCGASALVGSCNGLVCFVETGKYGVKDPIHICNPVTRECLYLQRFDENCEYNPHIKIHSGFGYSLKTNEYKVVRIIYGNYGSYGGHIQVYTLGAASGWRNKGVITDKLYSLNGVFFNGSLHWFQEYSESNEVFISSLIEYSGRLNNIMVFDLSDETFHVIQGPTPDRTMRPYILRSFGESLCVGEVNGWNSPSCLDIWTYKKTSLEKSIAATDNKEESWSWCKEFSISARAPVNSSSAWHYKPFALTKSGLVILEHYDGYRHNMYRDTRTLLCYDPKTGIMNILGIWNYFEAIPHTNSFVSLKALGERTCKKRESGVEKLASLRSNELLRHKFDL